VLARFHRYAVAPESVEATVVSDSFADSAEAVTLADHAASGVDRAAAGGTGS
jgi:hypothetical protein